MQKLLNLIFLGITGIIITGILCLFYTRPKEGYIEIAKVYNDFQLKKELDIKLKNIQQARIAILDSLEREINIMSTRLKADDGSTKVHADMIEAMKQDYLQKREQFTQDNQVMTTDYVEQIMNQLNQYIRDYGKANKYTFIHGTEGNGSIMYAEEARNISNEVLEYINQRYTGKK